jgi:hypothetical protein
VFLSYQINLHAPLELVHDMGFGIAHHERDPLFFLVRLAIVPALRSRKNPFCRND